MQVFEGSLLVTYVCENGADASICDDINIFRQPIIDGEIEIVKLLLLRGANINQTDQNHETPVYYAASNGRYDIVEYLCENGADASISDQDGLQTLLKPSGDGEKEIVKILVSKGANPSGGLQAALEYYHYDIVKILIQAEADVNKVSYVEYFLTAGEPFKVHLID